MTDIIRVRCELTGGAVVGPSVTTFYTAATSASATRAAINAFFSPLVGNLPSTLAIVVPSSGEVLDSATGEFVDVWSSGSPTTHQGTDAGVFAQGVGARVVWATDGITNRRRVRGSTFICPIGAGGFQSDGTIATSFRTALDTAASTMVSSLLGGLVIWTRPIDGAGGKLNLVVGSSVPDKVTWLRSRRT